MKSFRRALTALALASMLAYAGAMVWLVTQETRLVFRAGTRLGEARPAQPWEQVKDLPAWIIPGKDAAPWVIYLHGNSSDISLPLNIVHYEHLRELGLNVLAPEYRGLTEVLETQTKRCAARIPLLRETSHRRGCRPGSPGSPNSRKQSWRFRHGHRHAAFRRAGLLLLPPS